MYNYEKNLSTLLTNATLSMDLYFKQKVWTSDIGLQNSA